MSAVDKIDEIWKYMPKKIKQPQKQVAQVEDMSALKLAYLNARLKPQNVQPLKDVLNVPSQKADREAMNSKMHELDVVDMPREEDAIFEPIDPKPYKSSNGNAQDDSD